MVAVLTDAGANMEPGRTAIDAASDELGWRTVNDNVMGGRSRGGFAFESGVLVFRGSTNTDGGGFSSIRSTHQPLDLAGAEGMALRVLGDGRTYTMRLETADRIAYWASFPTSGGEDFETVHIPFNRFAPRRRGQRLSGPPLKPAAVVGLGLMIYDGLDGPFQLQVDRIEVH
jgi:monofunctional biosynthetic peptidoglycan transglycosylase